MTTMTMARVASVRCCERPLPTIKRSTTLRCIQTHHPLLTDLARSLHTTVPGPIVSQRPTISTTTEPRRPLVAQLEHHP